MRVFFCPALARTPVRANAGTVRRWRSDVGVIEIGLCVIGALVVLTTVLPEIPVPYGIFRIFDFPRLQNTAIGLAVIVLLVAFFPLEGVTLWTVVAVAVAVAVQAYHIARFTPLWRSRSLDHEGGDGGEPRLSVVASNVKLSNGQRESLRRLIDHRRPDIVILMEIDEGWLDDLDDVLRDYPHQLREPADTGYGLFLGSRLPLRDAQVLHLLSEHVPSFDIRFDLHGHPVRMFVLHPEPPVALRDTKGRDAELAAVGLRVRDEKGPLVVTGDLNDVAWSHTTRRFLRISRLVDPREGRGFYNSFDARYPLLRWPLDHIFHSEHFRLVSMERGPFIGSDHFPMLFTLALPFDTELKRERDPMTEADRQDARSLIEDELREGDEPVGMDWEK